MGTSSCTSSSAVPHLRRRRSWSEVRLGSGCLKEDEVHFSWVALRIATHFRCFCCGVPAFLSEGSFCAHHLSGHVRARRLQCVALSFFRDTLTPAVLCAPRHGAGTCAAPHTIFGLPPVPAVPWRALCRIQ